MSSTLTHREFITSLNEVAERDLSFSVLHRTQCDMCYGTGVISVSSGSMYYDTDSYDCHVCGSWGHLDTVVFGEEEL